MQHLDDPGVRIVDLGKPRDDYEAAHIPRAQYVDWRVELIDPDAADYFGVAQPEAVEALLSRLGVSADSIVVLYDSQSSRIAARMYWTLRRYVRKPRGSAPGSVVPDRVRTVFVRPDEAVAERLAEGG